MNARRPITQQPHIKGCRTNGGTVSPQLCGRCNRDHAWAYEIALKKLDRQANRGR